MQTIKVKTNSLPWGCNFTINGKEIAGIGSDFCNPGKYSARFGACTSGGNIATFADAVEFISYLFGAILNDDTFNGYSPEEIQAAIAEAINEY